VSERAERTNPTHIAIAIAKYIYLTPRHSAHLALLLLRDGRWRRRVTLAPCSAAVLTALRLAGKSAGEAP
jgi:hypothetical protein